MQYRGIVEHIRQVLAANVPPEGTVLVISKGDDTLLQVDGLRTRHFPQDEHGRYAGYYPADSDAAIAHLEHLRGLGAEFLLLPGTAFWWLDHYADFAQHLEQRHRRVFADKDCILFQLAESAGHQH